MLRKIVEIDESKCDGCGRCVPSCAEGAIAIVDGKARLVGDILCDGLGACLGECPRGALRVVEREAAAFDEAAVRDRLAGASRPAPQPPRRKLHLSVVPDAPGPAAAAGGCPGSRSLSIARPAGGPAGAPAASRLAQWPVQLHLVSPGAPYFRGADLLVAADCVPFAYARFHEDFLDGRALVVGCPKLDDVAPYATKLAAILGVGGVRSVTVVRMEVPCCGGISRLVHEAVAASGAAIPVREVVVKVDGTIRG